jgi:hypothetical protein
MATLRERIMPGISITNPATTGNAMDRLPLSPAKDENP